MTNKFDLRRGLLLGALGGGLAPVLASCESVFRTPQVQEEQPVPDLDKTPAHFQRRVIYQRKKVPLKPASKNPTPSDTLYSTGGGGGSGGGGSGGQAGGWSDRRLKTDIHILGHSPSGLTIYQFRYVWGGPIYVGVMAQELLKTRPDAVIVTDSGYLMVDYDLIDVKMMTLESYRISEHQFAD